jgi:hypothetical protein
MIQTELGFGPNHTNKYTLSIVPSSALVGTKIRGGMPIL